MTHKPLRLIITGGTIDKIHDPTTESLIFDPSGASQIPDMLKHAKCDFPIKQQIMQIDSADMKDSHRGMLLHAIEAAEEEQIVITHGTSTMEDTAQFLAAKVSGKTVVLTGAMRPLSLFLSDGPFNLGGAMIAAQTLPAGVYGVMNGRVFAAADLRKNVTAGRFDQ